MDNGALPGNIVNTVLANRNLGHAITGLGFLLDALNNKVNELIDKYKLVDEQAYVAGRAALQSRAKNAITDDNDPFTTFFCVSLLLGPNIKIWEPETIWLTLNRRFDIDLSVQDRSELLSIFTLQEAPEYYYDAAIFKNVAMSLNGFEPNPELIEELTPGQLAWAVIAAEFVRKFLGYNKEEYIAVPYQYEPLIFMAVVLHREGYILAPPPLNICQEYLDEFNQDGAILTKNQVDQIWDKIKNRTLKTVNSVEFSDNPVEVQMGRMLEVLSFLDLQCDILNNQLKPLLNALKPF